MKQRLKSRAAIFLCLLLTIPTLLGAIPQAELEAQAAGKTTFQWIVGYNYGSSNMEARILLKTKDLYIGDYATAYEISKNGYYKYYEYASLLSGVTYKSSNTRVASVNKSGLVTPKKAGKTTITMKFKGKTVKCKLNVVSSKLDASASDYKKLQQAAKTLNKKGGKKITASNRYEVFNANISYKKELEKAYKNYQSQAMSPATGTYINYSAGSKWIDIVAPALQRANVISQKLSVYIMSKNPIGTSPAKLFKVNGLSGKKASVTAKLTKNVTEDQIFGIQAAVSSSRGTRASSIKKISKSSKTTFPVKIKDMNTKKTYTATATAKKGKNTLEIKLNNNKKLVRGHKYKLIGVDKGYLESVWVKQGRKEFTAR